MEQTACIEGPIHLNDKGMMLFAAKIHEGSWDEVPIYDVNGNAIGHVHLHGVKPTSIRPEIMDFALAMERVMARHDRQKGISYRNRSLEDLLRCVDHERAQLSNAIGENRMTGEHGVDEETVDLANFAMMIYTNARHP